MRQSRRQLLQLLPLLRLAALLLAAGVSTPATAGAADGPAPLVPSVVLTDESGRQVNVYDDLAKGHVVAMNFIFTTCSTICQPMSATFSHLEPLIGSRPVRLVSVTLDPEVDTPDRLAAWKAKFHGGAAWTLLTGSKTEIDRLRKALGLYTPDRASHSPTVVLLDDIHGRSTRVNGLASASTLLGAIDALAKPEPATAASAAAPAAPASTPATQPRGAGTYFQGLSLIDQHGRQLDLYADIIKGHTVVINSFFASCQSSCPVLVGKLASLQARFGDQLGRRLRFVSITVDPGRDTPERLRDYATEMKAKDGWLFLTGSPAAVEAALKKLGQQADTPEAHTNVIIVGNDATGLWKKAFGLATTEAIGDVVQSVLEDRGAP